MPNHVQNRLQLFGPEAAIAACKAALVSKKDPEHVVDFNSILPMPEELKNTSKGYNDVISDSDYAEFLAKRSSDGTREGLPEDKSGTGYPISTSMAKDYYARFGATNWYDWSQQNWQTKWGSYSSRVDETRSNVLWYQTAWSTGNPLLFQQFSAQHPEVTIVHEWADEDTGSNTGRRAWKNGKLFIEDDSDDEGYYKDGSVEAFRTAFMLGRDRNNYRRSKAGERWAYRYHDESDEYNETFYREHYANNGYTPEQIEEKVAKGKADAEAELAELRASIVSDKEEEADVAEYEAFCARMLQEPELN